MRWRQVFVLYAVLGALGAQYWFVERGRRPADAVEPVRRRLLALDAPAVREVRVARGDRRVVARAGAGQWTVVEPPAAPIPPDLVAAFVTALLRAEEVDVVAAGGADAAAYGLDATAVRVELVGDGAGHTVVTIGAPNPTGTLVYARRGDEGPVLLIGRDVRYYEDLLFDALPAAHVPAAGGGEPIGR